MRCILVVPLSCCDVKFPSEIRMYLHQKSKNQFISTSSTNTNTMNLCFMDTLMKSPFHPLLWPLDKIDPFVSDSMLRHMPE